MMMRPPEQDFRLDGPPTSNTAQAMVDAWISRELKSSYNQALAEPVPETLLQLIAEFPDRDRP